MISIIVPTYNERENLEELFERIARALEGREFEIIVVDDDSPDKTWKKAEELAKKYPVKVIRRTNKRGLSSAVIRGFKEANSEILVVMDADLQHPPEVIPKLIEAIEEGVDVAIASRYVKGGKVENWYWWRKLISKGAIMIGRVALPRIRNIKDPVSGFFALRRKVIEDVELNPVGFKILLEILIKGKYERVAEVPFIFGIRKAGESKLTRRQVFNYLKHLYRLMRWEGEIDRLVKFSIVGLSGILVNEGVLLIFVEFLGWDKRLAVLPAIELSILNNFIWNDLWTFRDLRRKPLYLRLFNFHLAALAGAVVQGLIYLILLYVGIHYLIANLIAIGFSFIVRFLFNRNITWD